MASPVADAACQETLTPERAVVQFHPLLLKLSRRLANHYNRRGYRTVPPVSAADLYQAGAIALITYGPRWYAEGGASQLTYLYKCVRGQMINYYLHQHRRWFATSWKKAKRRRVYVRVMLQSDMVRNWDGSDGSIHHLDRSFPAPETAPPEDLELTLAFWDWSMRFLDKRLARLLGAWCHGETVASIAERECRSPARVYQLIRRAVLKVQQRTVGVPAFARFADPDFTTG